MCKSINLGLFLALVVFLTRPSRFWANPKSGDLLTSDDVINDDIIICYIYHVVGITKTFTMVEDLLKLVHGN